MKKFLVLFLNLVFLSNSEAMIVTRKTGNVLYNSKADKRTGNFSIKRWPHDCLQYKVVRDLAIQDTLKRCEYNEDMKCEVLGDTKAAISPVVMAEDDAKILFEYPKFNIEPDAYYFTFPEETRNWYLKNCPEEVSGKEKVPTLKVGT